MAWAIRRESEEEEWGKWEERGRRLD